jgi:hypothetical protein
MHEMEFHAIKITISQRVPYSYWRIFPFVCLPMPIHPIRTVWQYQYSRIGSFRSHFLPSSLLRVEWVWIHPVITCSGILRGM